MKDIVFPEGNEEAFIAMAKTLGYKELWFVYDNKKKFYNKKTSLTITNILLIKKQFGQSSYPTLAKCTMENIRYVVEHVKPCMVYDVESDYYKDFIHQRAGGLNHIICALMKKNNITMGFSFSQVLKKSGMKTAQIIGRITQNIELCRKYDVVMTIASFAKSPREMRSPQDVQSFFIVLGMNAGEAKKGIK